MCLRQNTTTAKILGVVALLTLRNPSPHSPRANLDDDDDETGQHDDAAAGSAAAALE